MSEARDGRDEAAARRRRVLRGMAGQLAVLTAAAFVFTSQIYVGYRSRSIAISFGGLFVLQLGHWYLWAIAGPAAWALSRRWPVAGAARARNLARHVGAAIVTGLLVVAAYVVLYWLLVQIPALARVFGAEASIRLVAVFLFASYFHVELLVYGCVVTFAHAVDSNTQLRIRERDALRLTTELATARLQVLRSQLQPHFLFNTLHTVGSLVLQREHDRALQMLAELGDLLRLTLDRRNTDLVPLREEIDYLQRYLRIEEARFGDRLHVAWRVDPDALTAAVPAFILQPLVENALRHGIARRTEDARIEIAATAEASVVRLSVCNDGPPLPAGWSIDANAGFGLTNVRERLRGRTPPGSLTLENAGQTGVVATLTVPRWRAADAAALTSGV